MLHLLPRVVILNIMLICFLCLLIVLARSVFSSRGGQIAYESSYAGNWDIFLLDVGTGLSYNLTRNPADDLDPAWSPDGTQLAFSSERDGDNLPELYVMDGDGGSARRISNGSGGYRSPDWSQDGAFPIFMLGFGQIYRMNSDGGGEHWLAAGFLPSLSPDGASLLYSAENTSPIDSDIYSVSLTSHRVTNLTNNLANEWGARWSPNGTRIAFSSLRGGMINIYVMNNDGSNTRAVTRQSLNDSSPAWSPDGTRIAYTSDVGGVMQLFVIDSEGGVRRQLTHRTSSSHSPAWRPHAP